MAHFFKKNPLKFVYDIADLSPILSNRYEYQPMV